MPYVTEAERKVLDNGAEVNSPGQLNYLLAKHVDDYLGRGFNYTRINDVIGVLSCLQMEIYRELAAPYEDEKKRLNGGVFNRALKTMRAMIKHVRIFSK